MDERIPRDVGQNLAATIVSSYVKHNKISANDLPTLIASVYRALSGVEKNSSPAEPVTPAVPVRQSVRPDYVVCLECGFRSQTLRRHLRLQHGLDRAAYFARWRLPPNHPITAPSYSARRSAVAKQLGLGRRRQAPAEPGPAPSAKSRRRARSKVGAAPAP
jgi:MucR family transcriptional regulator, transcriptional regulator of exopolysaccharide biosynthesis